VAALDEAHPKAICLSLVNAANVIALTLDFPVPGGPWTPFTLLDRPSLNWISSNNVIICMSPNDIFELPTVRLCRRSHAPDIENQEVVVFFSDLYRTREKFKVSEAASADVTIVLE